MKATVVVGNPKPRSRTRSLAETLLDELVPADCDSEVIDLADHGPALLEWPSEQAEQLTKRVAVSDLVIVASPTYKATYTGLLKLFLDRYPSQGLAGVTAIPLLTGADLTHSMGVDVNLGTLLTELGALVPTRGVYVITGDMERATAAMSEAAEHFRAGLQRLRRVADDMAPLAGAEVQA